MWHDYFNTTTGWSGWGSLGAPSSATLTDNVAVGTNSSGNEELFALADGSVWHDFFNTTTGWSGWSSLGGAPGGVALTGGVAVGDNSSGSEDLLARLRRECVA